jgi:glycosyltransferase involved in cell wall biosynthesis
MRALRAAMAEAGSALRRVFMRARTWRLACATSATTSSFASSATAGVHNTVPDECGFDSAVTRGRFAPVRVIAVVPAYFAESSVGEVVRALRERWPGVEGAPSVIVVDDGSRDHTGEAARAAGAYVVRHPENRGKGAALRTGFERARAFGARAVVSVDADGQHPAEEALRLALHPAPLESLVLGVRDLVRAGAPRANQRSNAISNFFLSRFTRRELRDTQCGLRRYPLERTLALAPRSNGYAFEAEVVLRAARAGWDIEQVPVRVLYPPDRRTHFHSVRDPARIVFRVVSTLLFDRGGP